MASYIPHSFTNGERAAAMTLLEAEENPDLGEFMRRLAFTCMDREVKPERRYTLKSAGGVWWLWVNGKAVAFGILVRGEWKWAIEAANVEGARSTALGSIMAAARAERKLRVS